MSGAPFFKCVAADVQSALIESSPWAQNNMAPTHFGGYGMPSFVYGAKIR